MDEKIMIVLTLLWTIISPKQRAVPVNSRLIVKESGSGSG